MERRALGVIVLGAAGALFSIFWVIFGAIVWGMGVAGNGPAFLLIVVGGLLPFIGSAWVLWAGISHRVSSSRLRDLAVLAHRFETVSAAQLAVVLSIPTPQAEHLLSLALRRGMVSALQSRGTR
jgi:hypothetical protein